MESKSIITCKFGWMKYWCQLLFFCNTVTVHKIWHGVEKEITKILNSNKKHEKYYPFISDLPNVPDNDTEANTYNNSKGMHQ